MCLRAEFALSSVATATGAVDKIVGYDLGKKLENLMFQRVM